MKLDKTGLSYRRSAIEGASPIGLIIALFDTFVGDLRRAAGALRKNDIETRCRELNHAVLVLGQLESWIDLKNGGETADTLSRFYAYLRAKMMEAAVGKSAKVLDTQIDMILHVRTAWQQLDNPPSQKAEQPAEAQTKEASRSYTPETETTPDRVPFSFSA